MTFYKQKYLKYKSKVQKLTNQFGGESKDCDSIIFDIEKMLEPNLIDINNEFKNSKDSSLPLSTPPFDIQNLSSNKMTIKDFKTYFRFMSNRYLKFSLAEPLTEKIIDILSQYDQKGIQTIKDLYDEYKKCKEGSSNESSNEEKSESRSSSDDKKELSQDELRKLFDKFQRNKKLNMPLLARLLTVKRDNDLYNLSLKLRLSIGFPENLFQNDLTTGKQYGDLLAIIYTQNVDKDNELDFNGFVNFVKCGVNRDFVDTVASNINCKNQRESEERQRKQKEAEEREKQREEREKQRREAEERQRREREQREAERERERQQREAEEREREIQKQQRERREAEERERERQKEREAKDKRFEEELRQMKNDGEEERKRFQRGREEWLKIQREREEEEKRREQQIEREAEERRQRVAEEIDRSQREDRERTQSFEAEKRERQQKERERQQKLREAEERIQKDSTERTQRFNAELRERYGQPQKEDEVNDELLAKYLQEEEDRKIAEQEQSNIEMNNPQQKGFPVFQQPVYSQQSPSTNNYNQNQSLGNKYGIPMRGQAQGVQSPNASQYGIPMRGQTQGAQAQNVFQPGYMPQPGFQGFQQPGYQGFQQPGYQGFQQPGYPQPGYQQPYMPQPGYPQTGYQQPGYQQPYMPQPGYGNQQPMYPQSRYQQPGYGNQQQNPNQNNQFGGKLEPDYNGIKFRIYKK
tara:strand:+ start:7093 stop:9186 length:2094 start_codon:yes stop_codon:yes gene_type:complete